MKPPSQIEALFAEAIAIASSDERRGFLDRACRDDATLRVNVERLVENYYQAGEQFLERSPFMSPAGETTPIVGFALGTRIGPYALRELIGEGGMGLVYVAEQQKPVRRSVALKLIKPGMDSNRVLARFDAERQALALMDHPNIAKVLDAGTAESGRPYFVMELVRGISITDYCDQARLTIPERLRIFLHVCRAIHHAHSKGVIHRDLKPSNVLVTSLDGHPMPVVIDFGVAKALDQPLTERTLYTGFSQMVGTPLYMSPEQAEFNQRGVDTRSDVYSLGVLLYELVTGATPFDVQRLNEASYDEFRRIICEEEPPRPSDRLSTLGIERRSTVTARRAVDGRKLLRQLRGDLETICLKCLEKDPNRRYVSVALLGDDIQSFLANEPIRARPSTIWYRTSRWVRRRPAASLLVALYFGILMSLAGGVWVLKGALAGSVDQNLPEAESLALQGRQLNYADNTQKGAGFWKEQRLVDLQHLLVKDAPVPNLIDLRGFEWRYLHQFSNQIRLLDGSKSPIYEVGFLKDGQSVLAANEDGNVRVYDQVTGKVGDTKADRVYSLSDDTRTPNGIRAVSASTNPKGLLEFKVWEVVTGRTVSTWIHPPGFLSRAVISPDGRFVASVMGASYNSPQEIWLRDLSQGQQRVFRPADDIGVSCLRFSPDSTCLAIANNRRKLPENPFAIEMREVATGQERYSAMTGHLHVVFGLAFTPDGQSLASGDWDGQIKIWDATNGQCRSAFSNLNGGIVGLEFSPDGKQLAATTSQQEGNISAATLVDASTGKAIPGSLRVKTFERQSPGRIRHSAMSFSPDKRTLALGCGDGHVCLWNWQECSPYQDLVSPTPREAWSVAFAADSRTLLVGYDDEVGHDRDTLQLWDVRTRKVTATLPGHTAMVSGVAYSPDGQKLASASYDYTVKLWGKDSQGNWTPTTLRGHTDELLCVAFSPDGLTLVTGSKDRTLKIWNAATGTEKYSLAPSSNGVSYVAFAPDGGTFAASRDGIVSIHETATGKHLITIEDSKRLRAFAFAPDGKTLATADVNGELGLWDVTTGTERTHLPGHTDEVWALAYSPDGKTLASAGKDGTVRLWQAATGRELLVFRDIPASVHSLAFSPDNTILAAALHNGTVRLWHAPVIETK